MIWGNTYYEVKLKTKSILYNNDQFIFSTRIGDLYLYYSKSNDRWGWSNPKIYETKFEAILEIGVQLFRGYNIQRSPYSIHKHIEVSMNYIPERMI
jgi:hypothetical protein